QELCSLRSDVSASLKNHNGMNIYLLPSSQPCEGPKLSYGHMLQHNKSRRQHQAPFILKIIC
ncbi:hypothetical protein IRJ41_014333, partial [Triplophysa rosa]